MSSALAAPGIECELPLSYSGCDNGVSAVMSGASSRPRLYTYFSVRGGTSMALPRRPLGMSGLALTTVGFGAWAVGGADWAFTWGPQDDEASLAAMRRAVDLGVNWIDT